MTNEEEATNEEETNNVVDLTECTDAEIDAWQTCIKSAIFNDLIALNNLDEKIFSELFYGRTNETLEFLSTLELSFKTGKNFIVIGEAGVGKSTFLYKLLLDKKNGLDKYFYSIFIDFRVSALALEAALISLIDKIDDYFKEVEYPIHTLDKPRESTTIHFNLLKINEHLNLYKPGKKHKALLFMVDDLDYADDFWLQFLYAIHNLVLSPKISFVLSVRPLLEYKIQHANDALYRELIRNPKKIVTIQRNQKTKDSPIRNQAIFRQKAV